MYCPTCGSEERQLSQYCRACGTDLRAVRVSLERPDEVTESAISARDHIGRAIADKIRETKSASQLQTVVEEVLPEIEKFLESPEERRLRRLRAGLIMSFIGLGGLLGGLIASLNDEDLLVLMFPGAIALFIGLAVVLNGLLFTLPRRSLKQSGRDLSELLERNQSGLSLDTADFKPAHGVRAEEKRLASVTEHTTRHLRDNP